MMAVLGCSSAATSPPVEPAAPAAPAGDHADPDGDHILGACDVCPEAAERLNDSANDDGCPETDDEITAAATDPTNQYSGPLFQVLFSGDEVSAPLDRAWQLDDGIEVVACIANAPDVAVASERAARLCKSLRASAGKVKVVELATAKPQIYVDSYGRARETTHGQGLIQVLRAKGLVLWQWKSDQLVRITPGRIVESRPLPAGCTWVTFEQDDASRQWRVCAEDSCDRKLLVEGYRARWTGTPVRPVR